MYFLCLFVRSSCVRFWFFSREKKETHTQQIIVCLFVCLFLLSSPLIELELPLCLSAHPFYLGQPSRDVSTAVLFPRLGQSWALHATWIRITVPIPSANDRLFLGRRVTLPSHTRFGHIWYTHTHSLSPTLQFCGKLIIKTQKNAKNEWMNAKKKYKKLYTTVDYCTVDTIVPGRLGTVGLLVCVYI